MLKINSKNVSRAIFNYTFWEETIASDTTAEIVEQSAPIVKDSGNGATWELTGFVSGWKYDTNSSLLDASETTSIGFWSILLILFLSSVSTITE